jgi:hypothetical protein
MNEEMAENEVLNGQAKTAMLKSKEVTVERMGTKLSWWECIMLVWSWILGATAVEQVHFTTFDGCINSVGLRRFSYSYSSNNSDGRSKESKHRVKWKSVFILSPLPIRLQTSRSLAH